MNTRNILKKLTSRKFWAALIAVILSILTMLQVSASMQAQIEALSWGVAALIAYILGEGLVDAKGRGKSEKGEKP